MSKLNIVVYHYNEIFLYLILVLFIKLIHYVIKKNILPQKFANYSLSKSFSIAFPYQAKIAY